MSSYARNTDETDHARDNRTEDGIRKCCHDTLTIVCAGEFKNGGNRVDVELAAEVRDRRTREQRKAWEILPGLSREVFLFLEALIFWWHS